MAWVLSMSSWVERKNMSLGISLPNMLGQERDAFIIIICEMGEIIMSSLRPASRSQWVKCKVLCQCLMHGGCCMKVAEMLMVVNALSESSLIKWAGRQWGAPRVGDGGWMSLTLGSFSASVWVELVDYTAFWRNHWPQLIKKQVPSFPWRRKWQPTPVFLPGEFHGQRSLVDCSPWGCKELDMTEQLTVFTFSLFTKSFIS